jgi:hypothetical protein
MEINWNEIIKKSKELMLKQTKINITIRKYNKRFLSNIKGQ